MMCVFNSRSFGCFWMRLFVMLLFVASMHHSSFSVNAVSKITTAALQSEKVFLSTMEAVKAELQSLRIPLRTLDVSKLKTNLLWNPVTKEPTSETQAIDTKFKSWIQGNVFPSSSLPPNEQPLYELKTAALCQRMFMSAICAIIDINSHLYIEGIHSQYTTYFKYRLKPGDDVNDQLNIFLSKTIFTANPVAGAPVSVYEDYFGVVTYSNINTAIYLQTYNILAKFLQFKNFRITTLIDYFEQYTTTAIFFSMLYNSNNIPPADLITFINTVTTYKPNWFSAFRRLFNDDPDGRSHLFTKISTPTTDVPKTDVPFFAPSFSDLEWINEQKFVYFYINRLNFINIKNCFSAPPDDKSQISTIISIVIFIPYGSFKSQYVPFLGKLSLDPTSDASFTTAYNFIRPIIEENEDHRWKLPSEEDFKKNIASRTSFVFLYSASLKKYLREPLSQTEYVLFMFRSFFATERIFYPSSLLLKSSLDANKYLPRGGTISVKFFENNNFKLLPAKFREFWNFHCGCYDVMCGAIARRYVQFVEPNTDPNFATKSAEKIKNLQETLGPLSIPMKRRLVAECFWTFTKDYFAISEDNHFDPLKNGHYAFGMLRSFLDVMKNVSREFSCNVFGFSADSLGVGGVNEWSNFLSKIPIGSFFDFLQNFLSKFMGRFPTLALDSLPKITKDSRNLFTLPATPSAWLALKSKDTNPNLQPKDPVVYDAFHEQFKETTKGTAKISAYIFDNCINSFMNYLVQNYSKVLLLENPNDAIPKDGDDATVKTRKTKLRTKKIFQFINSRCEFDTFRTDHNVRFSHPLPPLLRSSEEIISNTLNEHLTLKDPSYDIDNVLFWMTVDMIFTSLIFTDVDMAKRAQTIKDDPEGYLSDESEKSLTFVFSRLNIFGLDKVIKDNLTPAKRMAILMNENNHFLFYVTFMYFGVRISKKKDSIFPDENYSLKYHLWYSMYLFQSGLYTSDATQQTLFDKNRSAIRETAETKLKKYKASEAKYLNNDPDASFLYVPQEHSLVKMRTTSVYRMFNPFRPLENSISSTPYEFYVIPTPKAKLNKNENDL